jgi:hypothetical protein
METKCEIQGSEISVSRIQESMPHPRPKGREPSGDIMPSIFDQIYMHFGHKESSIHQTAAYSNGALR